MANINRWRYGNAEPIVAICQCTTEIEIGDLCFLAQGPFGITRDLRPASTIPDQGTLIANQIFFKCRFLGHASQRHRASHDPADDTEIRVNTQGVHEFICASATWEIGDLVGVAENAAGTALLNQTVILVPNNAAQAADRAIGRVARRQAIAVTSVFVDIVSEVMAGGPEGGLCSGSSSSNVP